MHVTQTTDRDTHTDTHKTHISKHTHTAHIRSNHTYIHTNTHTRIQVEENVRKLGLLASPP